MSAFLEEVFHNCMNLGKKLWTLSVLIPVFNEKKTIEEILRRVCSVNLPKQIVIVDDYSTDGTREFLHRLNDDEDLRRKFTSLSEVNSIDIGFQEENKGKGAAIRWAVEMAKGDVIIFQDADLEYDPQEYFRLVQPILDGRADVVYGSRFMGSPRRALFFWHSVGNRFLTTMSNAFTNLNLTDMETCYKVFRADILRSIRIESDRFNIEPEITVKVAKLQCRIYEVPISYSGRDYSEGKKIGWKDGILAIWAILKFSFKNPQG
ncbi:MAG: glycosyltransferase family 2 protein [Acidobacteria bacterium]|nr:glycosyltransferase family 2 protein [Acidobacteriota bacterium]